LGCWEWKDFQIGFQEMTSIRMESTRRGGQFSSIEFVEKGAEVYAKQSLKV